MIALTKAVVRCCNKAKMSLLVTSPLTGWIFGFALDEGSHLSRKNQKPLSGQRQGTESSPDDDFILMNEITGTTPLASY